MATIDVKDASGTTQAIEKPLAPGRAAAASSRPVTLSTEDKASLDTLQTLIGEVQASPTSNTLLDRVKQLLTGIVLAAGSAVIGAVSGAPVQSTTGVVSGGENLSAAISLAAGKPAGVQLPSNIDSATTLTFQLSYDGGSTYNNMYDSSGTEYSVTVAASRSVPLNYVDFIGATHMKVRLGTSGTPVTATADRMLTFSLVP